MKGKLWNRQRPTVSQLLASTNVPFVADEQSQKIFAAYKAEADKRLQASLENFDKSILTYSSAGLALSLAFLKDFVPLWQASYRSLLYFSWALFVIASVLTIFSFLISAKVQERSIEDAHTYYIQGDDSNYGKVYWQDNVILFSNWGAGITFVAALVLSSLFVAVNADLRKPPPSPPSAVSDNSVVQIMYNPAVEAGQTAVTTSCNRKVSPISHRLPPLSKVGEKVSAEVLCK